MTLPAATTGEATEPLNISAEPPLKTSLRSVSLVTSLTLVQLLLQFALQMALARYFGSAAAMDAYVAALALPLVVASILSGSLGYVLVPIIAERVATSGQHDAARVASQIGIYVTAASLALTLIAAAFSEPLANALCPGFDGQTVRLTAGLLRVLSLLMLLNCLIAYLNALYQAYHRFVRPAVAGVVGTLATLGFVLVFHERLGVFAVAWGVTAGAAVTVLMLLPFLMLQVSKSRPWNLTPDAGTRRCLALLVPLTLGAVYWRLEPLLDRWLGSFLETGSISHLGYAWRLVSGLMLIGTSGLSTVAFAAIATHAAAQRDGELNRELAYAMRFFLFLSVPICVGLAAFAHPVVRLLFEHGKFVSGDTTAVSMLVVLYVGAILGGGLGDLVSRTFYARQDTRTPVLVGTIVFTLAAALKFLLVRPWGAAGLAIASTAYYLANSGVLTALLVRRLSWAMLQGTGVTLARSLAASAVSCIVAVALIRLSIGGAVLIAALGGAVSYVVIMWLLGDEFVRRLLARFQRERRRA